MYFSNDLGRVVTKLRDEVYFCFTSFKFRVSLCIDELPNKRERLEQRTVGCPSPDFIKFFHYTGICSLRLRIINYINSPGGGREGFAIEIIFTTNYLFLSHSRIL